VGQPFLAAAAFQAAITGHPAAPALVYPQSQFSTHCVENLPNPNKPKENGKHKPCITSRNKSGCNTLHFLLTIRVEGLEHFICDLIRPRAFPLFQFLQQSLKLIGVKNTTGTRSPSVETSESLETYGREKEFLLALK
jgi:hypothetical protein